MRYDISEKLTTILNENSNIDFEKLNNLSPYFALEFDCQRKAVQKIINQIVEEEIDSIYK